MTDLPAPFTTLEWYQISMSVGLASVLSGGHDKELAEKAMAAMERVLGKDFHARICNEFPCVSGTGHYSTWQTSTS